MNLKNKRIYFIFASRLISTIADQLLFFLIPLIVYKITESASMSGLSFAFEWLPRVVAFLLSGLWGDNIGGGKLYMLTDFSRGSIILFFLTLLILGYGNIFWLLTIMGASIGFFSSQAQISLELTVKNNFEEIDIPKVQAKLQICEQLSLVLGPFLAGIILGYMEYPLLIGIVGFLFLISGFINKTIFINDSPKNRNIEIKLNALASFIKGCNNVFRSENLKLLVLFSILANFFYGVILALNPAIIKSVFQESDRKLSFMYSMAGIVTIGTLSLVPFLNRYFSVKFIGFTGIFIFLASAILLSQASTYEIYAPLYALLIAGVMLTNIMTRTYRVKLIPNADFGVTVGIIMFLIKTAMPISGFFVAAFSKKLGLQNLILWSVMGSIFAFFTLWLLLFLLKSLNITRQ